MGENYSMPSSPVVSERQTSAAAILDQEEAMQALLRPRYREIDREGRDQDQGREQFELWMEDTNDLLDNTISRKMRERQGESQF